MEAAKIAAYARELFDAHGAKAEAEAAQKAQAAETAGNAATAKSWRMVQKAISEMRGAHES
ncbi:hypothetical protein [Futiania mangrovi]|uniref:Uncharacterized protein n=1 Tax=Futiania mangrovi TaxID=2959716 RepID=A0A9J6PAC8_9PROT|nr:hypothetical protein [Futiania mangrovii]MCP1337020.1 hypothetical protein [Futiania mangrovii]